MLRVVTYNIRAAIGPGPFPPTWWRQVDRERLERLGQVVAALEPNVVALEEVALTTIDGVVLDMAAELSRLTGLESRYGAVGHSPIVDPDSGDRIGASFWGNALLSRLPIQSSRTIGLPTAADDELVEPVDSDLDLAGVAYSAAPTGAREARCLVRCEVDWEAELPLHLLSTHLTHVGSGQRQRQAGRIAEVIFELEGPLILMGDLNAPMHRADLEPLRSGLVDAFSAVGVPTTDPRRESCDSLPIDQILVRGMNVLSCRVVREAGDASDHWPVVAELEPAGASAQLER
ncbi:MAG: endonuclease/exonuclease/phosphatase family protein [Candidatus Limnocylindrales bacterium]